MGTIMDKPLDSSELEGLTTISLMAGLMGLDPGGTLLKDWSGGKLQTLGGGGGQLCLFADVIGTVSGNGWPCGLGTGFRPFNPGLGSLTVWL